MQTERLAQHGWIKLQGCVETLKHRQREIARDLGRVMPGRFGACIEVLRPRLTDAQPASLSAKFGLCELPPHIDGAHLPIPPRYLVLGCIEIGEEEVPTTIFDTRTAAFTTEEKKLLEAAVLFVRNGRKSFYSTILSKERQFIRFDLGCMETTGSLSEIALNLFRDQLNRFDRIDINWSVGDLLVIDNWRMLHGRGVAMNSPSRSLTRISIV